MHDLHQDRPSNLHGRFGYGYGWSITPNFHGYKLVSHGGSILVSTAHLALIPELKIGSVMAANTAGPPYATIAEGILSTLMGKDPNRVVPALRIREKMRTLQGTCEIYRGLERVRVVNKAGLLYLEQKGPFTDSLTPLIPENAELRSNNFYILAEGVKQPVEFHIKSEKEIDLYIERYRFHKKFNSL